MSTSRGAADKLRIAHVFRAPLGGLFRHVVDLAGEQASRGHDIGMFFDSRGNCQRVEQALAQIPGGLRLGVRTTPIRRKPGLSDISAFTRLCAWLSEVEPDVVHGHGSKGGFYARATKLAGRARTAARAYTPHGGSFNYKPGGIASAAYMAIERLLSPATDVFLFESVYIESRFDLSVGAKTRVRRVVHNGLRAAEFVEVKHAEDAAELLYVGELRAAKGVDTLLEAVALLRQTRQPGPRLVLVGSGPDEDLLTARARRLGIADRLSIPGPMPIRAAMTLGRILVVPSRAESLPYVVLEAAAARVPLVATDVGGIPEIFGPYKDRLGPSGDPADLARRLAEMLDKSPSQRDDEAADLSRFVGDKFSIESMTDAVLSGYRDALASRRIESLAASGASMRPRPGG